MISKFNFFRVRLSSNGFQQLDRRGFKNSTVDDNNERGLFLNTFSFNFTRKNFIEILTNLYFLFKITTNLTTFNCSLLLCLSVILHTYFHHSWYLFNYRWARKIRNNRQIHSFLLAIPSVQLHSGNVRKCYSSGGRRHLVRASNRNRNAPVNSLLSSRN